MAVVNPQTVSDNLKYPGILTKKEQTDLKKLGRLWEVMAAGNLIPPKSFQARTVNFEYLPTDKKELPLFATWLEYILEVPTSFNKSTLKLVVGKNSKITINFKEKKDPQESRKQTPTQYQEKGTTDVFNRVLDENERYGSIADMRKDKKLMDDLRDTFSGKTAKKNVGDHTDKIDDWMNTFFSQQDLFFMAKYSPDKWSKFEYHKQDWVTFWTNFIKKVKTNKGEPVGDYTTWNPSDIWAVYDKEGVNKAIDDAFKVDEGDPKLSKLNNLLIKLMKDSQLVGISLKKIEGTGAHMEEMNISPKTMKLAEVIELKMNDIELQLDNIVQQDKVTTYIKFARTHTMNINLNDKKKPGNLSFNTQIKGTAAQGGQAPVEQVLKLLRAKGSSVEFKNDHNKYPNDVNKFWEKSKDWEKKYEFVKTKSKSTSWESWDDFEDYLEDFYKDKKPQLAMTKLMQIDFYYDALKNYSSDQDQADFWIALLHLGMKVGDRFAPHAKIS
tara:strand:- start:227 stop:1717 length:1491 start_codon:yes stop_codon:yes gene_type:complete